MPRRDTEAEAVELAIVDALATSDADREPVIEPDAVTLA